MRKTSISMAALFVLSAAPSLAQVPVIDNATLSQATQTAQHTSAIMDTNRQILTTVNQTLQAVTGARNTGDMVSAALGNGFSMSAAPSLSSILQTGTMSWGQLGQYGQVATSIINGLNLVNNLTGSTAAQSGTDSAYRGAVNTTAALMGIVSGAQAAGAARGTAFQAAGAQIGAAPDVKASIDQNTQLQVQTGLTINELIGVLNAGNAALNAQHMQELAAQAKVARIMRYDAAAATLVGR